MKTRHFARGFVGALSLIGAIGAVACSSEPLSPEEAAEIGETSQAIAISGLDAPGFTALYPASIKLDAAKMFVGGGYSSAGAAIGTIKLFDPAASSPNQWALPAGTQKTLPTALGEPQILKIPGVAGKFLISGGRDQLTMTGSTVQNASFIYDETAGNVITPATMTSARVNHVLLPCGAAANSKVIAIAGRTSPTAVTNTMEVFTYNAATPASSTWAALGASGGGNLTLNNARTYHGAVAIDTQNFLVFGGEQANGTVLNSVELVTVDSNCANATKTAKGNLPAALTRFAFAKVPAAAGGFNVILAGGSTDLVNALSATRLYNNTTSDTWTTLASTLNSVTALPVITDLGAGVFKVAGGTDAVFDPGSAGTSLTQVQNIDVTAGTPAWTPISGGGSVTQLVRARTGHGQALVSGNVYASQGAEVSGGTLSFTNTNSIE
jgi:hypothetical protein